MAPVTHQEVKDEVAASELRGKELLHLVTAHFDQRIKDSERTLTWRMIATGGVVSVASGVVGTYFQAPGPTRTALQALANLLT